MYTLFIQKKIIYKPNQLKNRLLKAYIRFYRHCRSITDAIEINLNHI